MTFRYSLSYADWRDFHEALTQNATVDVKRYYLYVVVKSGVLLTLAYLSFVALNQYLLGIATLYFVWDYLRSVVPHTRHRKQFIESEASQKADYFIDLQIADDGMTETAFDIVSFCPWKTVTKVEKFKGVVIIRLSSGQCAIVPCLTLAINKLDPMDFVALIESKRQAGKEAGSKGGDTLQDP